MVAAYAGQLEAVTFLLDEGFCIEERDARLRTPIHAATKAGHINVRAFGDGWMDGWMDVCVYT